VLPTVHVIGQSAVVKHRLDESSLRVPWCNPCMHSMVFGDDGSLGASAAWGWITAQTWPEWRIDVMTVTHPERSTSQVQRQLHEWMPPSPRKLPQECRCSALRFLTVAADPREAITAEAREVLEGAAKSRLFKTEIRVSTAAKSLPAKQQTAFDAGADARGAEDYPAIVEETIKRLDKLRTRGK
jgi:hypothetical protein